MFKQLGLGAVFTFDSKQAEASMARTHRGFMTLRMDTAKLRAGMNQVRQGIRGLAMVGTGLAVGLGLGARAGIAFEQQMANTQAVLLTSRKAMHALEQQALDLGSTTQYTATQVAQAQEILARAGFKMNETIAATPGILYAAAASGMDLAETANTIAVTLRAFGLAAGKAGMVADQMNKATTVSAITMGDLAEAMKYAAPYARQAGISLRDTLAVMSALGNVGIKGTMAGTSFGQMIVHLSKLTPSAQKALRALGVSFADVHGNMLPIGQVVRNFMAGLSQVRGNLNKTRVVAEVFGIRGAKAIQGMMAAMNTKHARTYQQLVEAIGNSAGTAFKMANIRLDTLHGRWILFKSALEGALIGIYRTYQGTINKALQRFADGLQNVALGIRGVRTRFVTDANGVKHALDLTHTKAWQVGRGIHDAFMWGLRALHVLHRNVINTARALGQYANHLLEMVGVAKRFDTSAHGLAKTIGKMALVTAAMGPALLAIGMAGKVIAPLVNIFMGLGKIALALPGWLKVVGLVLALVVGGGAMKGKKGIEGLMDSFKRLWANVKPILATVETMLMQMVTALFKAFKQISPAINTLVAQMKPLVKIVAQVQFTEFTLALKFLVPLVNELAKALASVIVSLSTLLPQATIKSNNGLVVLGKVFAWLGKAIGWVIGHGVMLLVDAFVLLAKSVAWFVKGVIGIPKMLGDFFLSIGSAIYKGIQAGINKAYKLIGDFLQWVANNKVVSWVAGKIGVDVKELKALAQQLQYRGTHGYSVEEGKQREEAKALNARQNAEAAKYNTMMDERTMAWLKAQHGGGVPVVVKPTPVVTVKPVPSIAEGGQATPPPQPPVVVHTKVSIDGKQVAQAVGRANVRQNERRGEIPSTHVRQILENGGRPMPKYGNLSIEAVY